jgi:dTDP-4-dehydrorhamnose reductase
MCEEGNNILASLLSQWKSQDVHVLPAIPQFAPTPADDIARVIFAMLQQMECEAKVWGIYHYCSADITTPFDFAEVVLASMAQFSNKMMTIKIEAKEEEGGRRKSRKGPALGDVSNQVLSCQKILNTFGICQRPWRGELAMIIERMEKKDER